MFDLLACSCSNFRALDAAPADCQLLVLQSGNDAVVRSLCVTWSLRRAEMFSTSLSLIKKQLVRLSVELFTHFNLCGVAMSRSLVETMRLTCQSRGNQVHFSRQLETLSSVRMLKYVLIYEACLLPAAAAASLWPPWRICFNPGMIIDLQHHCTVWMFDCHKMYI